MGRYRVNDQRAVLGHEPGTTFEADIPEAQEKRLLASGALHHTRAKKVDTVDPSPETNHEKEGI
jgi:hypothetical protein